MFALPWLHDGNPLESSLRAVSLAVSLAVFAFIAEGCKGNTSASASTSSGAVPTSMSVNVEANEKGFIPSSFDLQKGAPATLIFRRTTDKTCATQVVGAFQS